MRKSVVPLWLLAIAVSPALGSGYSVYEQGAKASAQAGAFAARADDPSAIFYNPAGITQLEGWQISLGTSAIWLGDTTFQSVAGGPMDEMNRNTLYPSHLYFTQSPSDLLSWGVGIYTPFGLETEWDDDMSVRFSSRHAELRTLFVTPTLAVRVGGQVSVAVGVSWVRGEVRNFSRNLGLNLIPGPPPFPAPTEGYSNLTGEDDAFTLNAGVLWAGKSGYQVGLTYRGGADLNLDGEVTFAVDPSVAPLFPDGPGSAVLPLPPSAALGFAYTGGESWEIEFDLVWTGWSDFDDLVLEFENQTPLVTDQTLPERWDDTFSYRLGFSMGWGRHAFRAGGYFDENPIPDETVRPSLPDADRWSLQAGYGFRTKGDGFSVDAYYQYLPFEDRQVPVTPDRSVVAGEYVTTIHLLGFTLGWKL